MDALKGLNLLVRFLLELCMLAAAGYWGFATHSTWGLKLLFGIGLPVLIAVLWGMFIAPKARRRLSGIPYVVLEFILLGSGALALFASGLPALGWIYTVVMIVSTTLTVIWMQ